MTESILWLVVAGAWEFHQIRLRKFVETMKKEAPETWGRFNQVIVNYAYSSNASELMKYIRTMEYKELKNPEITRLGNWAKISEGGLVLSIWPLISYYAIRFFMH